MTENKVGGVFKKLMASRLSLHSKPLKKTGRNQTKHFFELEDFLPETLRLFGMNGLCGVVSFTAELATLTITDVDDGSQIVITSPMGSAKLPNCHEVQNIGATESYQRRYLWMDAMEVVENDVIESSAGAGNDRLATDLADITKAAGLKALESLWVKLGKEYTDAQDREGYKAVAQAVKAKKATLEGGA
jgi:hypothetical protein